MKTMPTQEQPAGRHLEAVTEAAPSRAACSSSRT